MCVIKFNGRAVDNVKIISPFVGIVNPWKKPPNSERQGIYSCLRSITGSVTEVPGYSVGQSVDLDTSHAQDGKRSALMGGNGLSKALEKP
jgi:hypothetical protein